MDGSNPKVSFIPKGSLVREESFLERRRPRSAIGFLAALVFLVSVGSYAGFYYYNNSLNIIVAEKTVEIKKAQKEFSDAPEVSEAKIFRARADLAKALLNSHTIVSPILTFLSRNTTESILYNKFSFKGETGGGTLDLSGEAPTYAALAYQADVFRTKTTELSGFSVNNVSLTALGTISFDFSMRFNQNYLLYAQTMTDAGTTTPQATDAGTTTVGSQSLNTQPLPPPLSATIPPDVTTQQDASSSATSSVSTSNTQGDASVSAADAGAPTATAVQPEKQSFLMMLWSKFKFW